MVNIRLEGDTRAALNKIRGLAEMDRKSLNAALGPGRAHVYSGAFPDRQGAGRAALALVQAGAGGRRQDAGGLRTAA